MKPTNYNQTVYSYEHEKCKLFTDEGQRLFLKVRDEVKEKLALSGAITQGCAAQLPKGVGTADGWQLIACIDRMVELGELCLVANEGNSQDWIYAKPWKM